MHHLNTRSASAKALSACTGLQTDKKSLGAKAMLTEMRELVDKRKAQEAAGADLSAAGPPELVYAYTDRCSCCCCFCCCCASWEGTGQPACAIPAAQSDGGDLGMQVPCVCRW